MTVSVIQALSDMHREAVEQIRAGDHNAFLVGFLTTSTMLELSSLTNTDLRLDEYADAAAQTISQYAPLDRILVETDAPYLTPHPHRGKRNEPAYVALVCHRLAELCEMSAPALAEATTNVALQFFQIQS